MWINFYNPADDSLIFNGNDMMTWPVPQSSGLTRTMEQQDVTPSVVTKLCQPHRGCLESIRILPQSKMPSLFGEMAKIVVTNKPSEPNGGFES